jgi:tetratricopeptide (TPR) repeat protein
MTAPSSEPRPARRRNSSTVLALRALAVVIFFLFAALGVVRLLSRSGGIAPWGAQEAGELGLYLLAGAVCSGLFVGLSAVLRALRGLHASMVRVEQLQADLRDAIQTTRTNHSSGLVPAVANHNETKGTPANPAAPWQRILVLLQDIRAGMLLTPRQRREEWLRLIEQEISTARALVQSLTAKGDFAQAAEVAASAQRKYPNETWTEELAVEVERAREQHETEDVNSYTKQVDDLISISAWERARQLVQQLIDRHPDAAEARQLMLRVEKQHRAFQVDQMRRMNAEIQRYANERKWEEALTAARTFLVRFPHSEDAETLRMQVPTLEANAQIEVRQRLEAEIMECAKQGRYIEAAQLARKIIEQYPDSPQAEVLRSQLTRLEELAHNPDAAPTRLKPGD